MATRHDADERDRSSANASGHQHGFERFSSNGLRGVVHQVVAFADSFSALLRQLADLIGHAIRRLVKQGLGFADQVLDGVDKACAQGFYFVIH